MSEIIRRLSKSHKIFTKIWQEANFQHMWIEYVKAGPANKMGSSVLIAQRNPFTLKLTCF